MKECPVVVTDPTIYVAVARRDYFTPKRSLITYWFLLTAYCRAVTCSDIVSDNKCGLELSTAEFTTKVSVRSTDPELVTDLLTKFIQEYPTDSFTTIKETRGIVEKVSASLGG
ncbi:MAG: hypothetical protein KAG66_14105, partial [Methylococcales bacterium]|nr:hypothetical protein [Methylococcales bacterium]